MKLVLVFGFLCVIVGLAVAEGSDEDYSKFTDLKLITVLKKYNHENKAKNPNTDSVINPPPRCKECERPDKRGKCRKIIGCVPT